MEIRLRRVGFVAIFALSVLAAAATTVSAQKATFLDSFIAFHSALFGSFGDEGPLAMAALDRMAGGLEAWEQSQAVEEAALTRNGVRLDQRARFYADHVRFEEATEAIARAIDAEPDRAPLHVFHGLLLEAVERRVESAAAFATATRLDPADPIAAYLAVSRSASADQQAATSAAMTPVSLTGEPASIAGPAPLMRLEVIPDSASTAPVFAPAAYAQGFAAFNRRRFRDAMSRFRSTLQSDPLVADIAYRNAHVIAGAKALREKRSAVAIDELEAAVSNLPGSSEAHRLLGLAYRTGGRLQEGVRELNTAVRLVPNSERARVTLGVALTESGNLAEAERVLRQTITAMPDSGEARWALAIVYNIQNRGLDAIDILDEAVALPVVAGRAALHWRIAQLAYRHQDHERVIAALSSRARLLPNDPAAHKDLGFAYLRVGRSDEALTELSMTLLLGGEDGETLSAIGRIHAAAERFEPAERALRRAVALDPANAQIHYALGNTLVRIGKTDEGLQHLKEFASRRTSAFDDERRRFAESPLPGN